MKLSFDDENIKSYKENESLYFHILKTKDQSPTCFTSSTEKGEAETMHSSQGAFTETDYVYGTAIQKTLDNPKEQYHFLNLGVGIGYNELSIICYCIKNQIPALKCHISSYEFYSELSHSLIEFYQKDKEHSFLGCYHNEILELYSEFFEIKTTVIKNFARDLISSKNWIMNGPINESFKLNSQIDCYLFDAYSSNTDPQLWELNFLNKLLSYSAETSVFSTYAATGDLKRCLKSNGFSTPKRKGFAFKRESTLAFKL